jgi:hypothetical protein
MGGKFAEVCAHACVSARVNTRVVHAHSRREARALARHHSWPSTCSCASSFVAKHVLLRVIIRGEARALARHHSVTGANVFVVGEHT